jgi:hypothetical protein
VQTVEGLALTVPLSREALRLLKYFMHGVGRFRNVCDDLPSVEKF